MLSQQVQLQVKTVISAKTLPHVAQTDVFMLVYKHLNVAHTSSSLDHREQWYNNVTPHLTCNSAQYYKQQRKRKILWENIGQRKNFTLQP